ncbi:hypothetical protein JSE7799_02445 [Jannaschia seosinensis]|uniref:Lipoprotein n=1 Tax=Jannaschia seosinensis TaxID=313367 RepID=A0A0M7BAA2_9RHOB|nr:hypothetical protein [Jannaschia seosinensis]CUH39717.1 hypothetical protein JSE7799_02445 [Jannaschia seosinensis]
MIGARITAVAAALLLTACLPTSDAPVPDPQAYARIDAPVPFAVRRLLPQGITEADVRVADNCYAYAYDGQIWPVLIPRGTQYCL